MMRIRSLYLALLFATLLVPTKYAISRDRVEECPKRTFGYDQPWAPRSTNPVWIAQPVIPVACSNCLEVNSSPVIPSPPLYGSVSEGVYPAQSPPIVAVYPAAFSLCVACPENATVIIDGRIGKSTARVRQYDLALPVGVLAKAIRMVVVDPRQKVLWEGPIIATAGGSETIVVTKEAANESAKKTAADSAKQEIRDLKVEIGNLQHSIDELVAIQPKTLKKRKNQLDAREQAMAQEKDSRDTMQNARDKLQDERDQLQQRRDKLQTERDSLQVDRENDFASKRNSLVELGNNLDKFQATRDHLQDARDTLQRERDALQQRRDKLQAERDAKH